MNITRIVPIIICMLLLSCNNVETDWETAKLNNSIQAFQDFIEIHPESNFIGDARREIYHLEKDSINSLIFNVPLSDVEINSVLCSEFKDWIEYKSPIQKKTDSIEALPYKPRKVTMTIITYAELNDTVWVIHSNNNTFSPDGIWTSMPCNNDTEVSYRITGSYLTRAEKIVHPNINGRLDSVFMSKNKLITSLNASEQSLLESDSIDMIYLQYGKVKPETYNKLYEISLMNHEFAVLNKYYEFIQDAKITFGNNEIISVFADSIVLTGSTENIWVLD